MGTELRLNGRADLHIHTNISDDGCASVQAVLDHVAQRRHLDVIAITDHDRLEASLWAHAHQSRYPFEIVPGVEVTSRDGHVLALWVHDTIPMNLSLEETAIAIHEQGGMAVLAHPFEPFIMNRHLLWRYFSQPEVLLSSGIDAVEVHNAGAFTPGGNWMAQRVFGNCPGGRVLPVVGNSDSHMPHTIGTGVTRFRGVTAADLRESLAHGWTTAEGTRWPITVYLKLLRISLQKKRSASLETKLPSASLTQP